MLTNIFDNVRFLVKTYTKRTAPQPSLSPKLTESEKKNLIIEAHAPGVLLDIMLSVISSADIADIEDRFDLFCQTISDITNAMPLMTTTYGDVALSLDLSIRRLNYLCHKLPPLTHDCSKLIKQLEYQLVRHYINSSKQGNDSLKMWQRMLGISPHWRQILEREGLVVVVDGVDDPGSGFKARSK